MRIKKTFRMLMLVLMTGILASCWDDFTEQTFNSANLLSFSFQEQDACEGIEKYVFNIDQFSGLVYNIDSLPYGSKVDYLLPSMTFQSTNGLLYLNDSIWDQENDTLDFSQPVKLTNTSLDGGFSRSYIISVNVHQVDPDSMIIKHYPATFPAESFQNKVFTLTEGGYRAYFNSSSNGFTVYHSNPGVTTWVQQPVSGLAEDMNIQSVCQFNSRTYATSVSGRLYVSVNGLDWTQTGDGSTLVTLYGSLNRKYLSDSIPAYLIGLVKNTQGEVCPARSADGVNWVIGAKINDDFPVFEYGSVKGTTVTNVQYYTVASGLRSDSAFSSSVWTTENGLEWVLVRSNESLPVTSVKGASLFYYNNQLICFGGIKSNGTYANEVSISKDHGKNWIDAYDDWLFPSVTAGLAYGSVYVEHVTDAISDKNREFIWYFGGQNHQGTSSSVWKGYEYSMIFIRR